MFKVKTPTEMLNELKSINTFIKSDDDIKEFPRTNKPLDLIPSNTKVHFDTLHDYKEDVKDVKDVEFNLLLKLTRMENKLEDIEKLLKSLKLE